MNLQNAQEQVSTWMKTFGQDVPDSLTMPDLETRKLRAKLMFEECLETIDALGIRVFFDPTKNPTDTMLGMDCVNFGEWAYADMTKIRDGIADLQVVTLGTAVACGIDAQSDFDEVMRSNNSKMWTDEEVAEMTGWSEGALRSVEIGEDGRVGGKAYLKASNETRCWIVKDASGKIVKSPSYSPANLR